MLSRTISAVALLSALLPTTLAQTHTDCNPLNTTGCPDMPALGGNATFKFNDTLYDTVWDQKNQGKVDWSKKGATFTIARSGDSPTLQSKFYMLFGRISIIMKASSGRGIVSSAILQSECLDEIDWEFLGSNTTHVMTNYFGKGNLGNYGRGKEYEAKPPQEDFHNYTIDWTKDRIQWWVDGKQVRELKPEEALDGKNYPQTPMNIRLGSWSGGDVENNNEGTVQWAGGETNFDEGPFTMTVQEVYAHDYTTAKEYSWEDMDASGSWEKVKVIQGKSEAIKEVTEPHGVKNRYNALSTGAKIGITVGVLSFVGLAVAGFLICFFMKRRQGRKEFAAYQAQQDKENSELLEYKGVQGTNTNMGYNRI